MKKIILPSFLFLMLTKAKAQNLVPNGDFSPFLLLRVSRTLDKLVYWYIGTLIIGKLLNAFLF